MKRYVLTQPAAQDLQVIKKYLAKQTGVRVARHVIRELRTNLEFLGRTPQAGHFRRDLTSRPVRFWPVYSYLIVYDPDRHPVEVLRVVHGARDLIAELR